MWYHFSFTSGANPYIAKTEEEAKKKIRSWKRKGYEVTPFADGGLVNIKSYIVKDI